MMRGQGKTLPPSFGLEGEWIVENHLFLYHSDVSHTQGGSAPRFTTAVPRHDGSLCIGFSSAQLAVELGVDSDVLIEANRSRDLIYLGIADIEPAQGSSSAQAFGFRLGDKRGYLAVEVSEHKGTA